MWTDCCTCNGSECSSTGHLFASKGDNIEDWIYTGWHFLSLPCIHDQWSCDNNCFNARRHRQNKVNLKIISIYLISLVFKICDAAFVFALLQQIRFQDSKHAHYQRCARVQRRSRCPRESYQKWRNLCSLERLYSVLLPSRSTYRTHFRLPRANEFAILPESLRHQECPRNHLIASDESFNFALLLACPTCFIAFECLVGLLGIFVVWRIGLLK